MKKMIKLLFGVMLCVSAFLSTTAFAQESGKCGDNLTWTLDNGVMTISGTGKMYDYGYDQETIPPWKEYASDIYKLSVSDGVETIGSLAFEDFINIETVDLPDSIISLGIGAFGGCKKLNKVKLSENTEEILSGCFRGTPLLSSIKLPKKLKKLGATVFANSGIEEIEIPLNVTEMERYTFEQADNLLKVKLPDNLTVIQEYSFAYAKRLGNVIFPENLKVISNSAFEDCISIGEVYLPNGLESIGDCAFRNCAGLKKVYIPSTVKMIDQYAFISTFSGSSENLPIIIYAVKGSTAETFAKEYGYTYEELEEDFFYKEDYKAMTIPGEKPLIAEFVQDKGKDIIKINADGKNVEFTDAVPFADVNNQIHMPVRAFAEAVGYEVEYDSMLQCVTVLSEEDVFKFVIGGRSFMHNNDSVMLNGNVQIINDRTFVPLRAFAEALGFYVITSSNYTVVWGE